MIRLGKAFYGILAGAMALPVAAPAQTVIYRAVPSTEITAPSATIDWDQWGVPHINAADQRGAFYALGWAQARGRPNLLLEMMGQGRGRAAELWGVEYWQSDRIMWQLGVPQALDTIYEAQGPEYQRNLDAFANGINAYFEANPEAGSEERRRALPVTARDVIGHGQRALNITFMAGREIGALQQRMAEIASEAAMRAADDLEEDAEAASEDGPGSNGWAIAPSRSESGNAMLLINPHLPWSGLFTWFETHITTPDINAYGATLIGQPTFGVGFNEHLGWTHTVNVHDGADVYELEKIRLPDGSEGYQFDGEDRAFDVETATVRRRDHDGVIQAIQLNIVRSVHGPVIAEVGNAHYAIRIAGLADPEHSRTVEQYWDMIGANNREAFEAAFSRMQMPMFNMIYADRDGEILYVSNGLNPVRARGDAEFWSGTVDGSDPDLLWTEYQPYDRLMRVANPENGFVQNSNEPGWTSTIPTALDPADYPADYPPPGIAPRPLHGISMVMEDSSISFDELDSYARDTRLTLADYMLDDLIAAAREDGRAELTEAADVLAAWDRRTNTESRGAVLFMLWASKLPREARGYAREWSFTDPASAPSGIANREAAVEALWQAAEQMRAQGGLDVAWGQAVRIPSGEGDETVPITLGPGGLGAFWVGYIGPNAEGGIDMSGGTSFVSTVEFGEQVRARALLPYGNFEERPEGVQNQFRLLSASRFRDVNFTPEAIAESSVMREELTLPAE